ncbi:MAG: alkaline phosphatase family protein [Planctomycetota bacterium]|nr:alkaline phosphatase family protein [Planctomycetota bacterium]
MVTNNTRTIIIGFDGADARLTSALMRQGLLPSFSALAQLGSFRQILSTTPAESAVAWTSFTMAANPGQTGIFDFVTRSPNSYAPRLSDCHSSMQDLPPSRTLRHTIPPTAALLAASATYRLASRLTRRKLLKASLSSATAALALAATGIPLNNWLPTQTEKHSSAVSGQPWYDRLAQLGRRSIALRIPMTFPAQAHLNVRLLAGLGVPDLRGASGSYTLLSDSPNLPQKTNHLPLAFTHNTCTIQLPGPPGLTASLTLRRLSSTTLLISSASHSITLKKGDATHFFPITFSLSPLFKKHAIIRLFYLPDPSATSLYITPLEPDPAFPPTDNPISSPPSFAQDLYNSIGHYRTVGWETQTSALSNSILDDSTYLADVQAALDSNLAQLNSQLNRTDWHNLMLVIQATDQAHHMFFDAQADAARLGSPLPPTHPLLSIYQRMDQFIAHLLPIAQSNNYRLIIMSDHGFSPFRRAVNLNTFLARKGYLALKNKSLWDDPTTSPDPWSNVDWSNSRAYALGLAGLYLNVAGREPQGIVKRPDEYDFLLDKLSTTLLDWRDPTTNQPILNNVYRSHDIYSGPHAHLAPDLILGLREGYRISSPSTLGLIPEQELTNNPSHWQADHCGIDSPLIPGICLTNFPINSPTPIPIHTLPLLLWPDLAQTG